MDSDYFYFLLFTFLVFLPFALRFPPLRDCVYFLRVFLEMDARRLRPPFIGATYSGAGAGAGVTFTGVTFTGAGAGAGDGA